jgi:2,4-dienoyl-CoA reductase-like NADH-dependent reductase (Old Yellow Enzyme family)
MSILFTPCRIGTLEVPNRFVRSATGESACTDGHISEGMVRYYERLAQGEIGLILTGHAYVREEGKTHEEMTGIHHDGLLPALEEWTERVHALGAKIVMQINHQAMDPNELSASEIRAILRAFMEAAGRVQRAGFDGVQVHLAHGYLLSQFMSPKANRRTDEWGGIRLAEEVLRVVRAEVGLDYPVLVKFNCDSLEPESLTLDESASMAQALEAAGADAIEVSGAGAIQENIRRKDQEAYFAPYARRIREAVSVPVILVGGLRSVERMEEAISEGVADLVSMSRPFIREPDIVVRFREGKEVADCISCGQCWSSKETANRCGVLEKRDGA